MFALTFLHNSPTDIDGKQSHVFYRPTLRHDVILVNQSDSARLSASLASKVKDEYSWERTMWKYMFDQNEGLIYLVWRIFVGSIAYW